MTTIALASGNKTPARNRAVAIWLTIVGTLVFLMSVVGGATRLTDSGLSITEWKPIVGAIPPLNDADWQDAFAKYQQIPEYHRVNKGMSLDAFKSIFWWEWGHRFLGRFIGLAFALPLGVLWLRGAIRRELVPKLLGVLALGAIQGGAGWYMVRSGLVDRIDVSQYRLALHLGIAFAILGSIAWLVLDLVRGTSGETPRASVMPTRVAPILAGAVFLQILLGALVAGLKAGLAYNTWPDMNGALVPPGLAELSPWYLNLFENVTAVQFNHRLMAYIVAALAMWNAWSLAPNPDSAVRSSGLLLAAAVMAQIGLGIWTLLSAVPLALGLAHQAGAAIVFLLAISHWHAVRQGRRTST